MHTCRHTAVPEPIEILRVRRMDDAACSKHQCLVQSRRVGLMELEKHTVCAGMSVGATAQTRPSRGTVQNISHSQGELPRVPGTHHTPRPHHPWSSHDPSHVKAADRARLRDGRHNPESRAP